MPNFSTSGSDSAVNFDAQNVDATPPGLEVEALTIQHREHLTSEGFTAAHIEQLIAMGVRSIGEIEARELGFLVKDESRLNTKGTVSSSGILFPFTNGFAQLRCDNPPTRKGKPAKYLTQTGKPSQAFLPDSAKVLTEGFKDAAAGTLIGGIPTGAVAGVSHVRKAILKGGGHTTLFDNDGWTNPSVFSALVTAAAHTGGKIQLVPEIEGEPKAGLCEYFKAGHTIEDYQKLLGSAMTIKKFLLELPNHWASAESANFTRLLRTVFSLAQNYLSNSELEQLATLCKAAGKKHHVPAPAVSAELKRVQGVRAKRAKASRAKAARQNLGTDLDLTAFGICPDEHDPEDDVPLLLDALGLMGKSMGCDLKLNRLTGKIEYFGDPINPNHYQVFVTGFYQKDISESMSVQVLSLIANKFSYHPALEYFEELSEKYGKSTIGLLDSPATRLLKTSNPLYDVMLRKTLTAMVARVYEPGCKWDYVMLLKGIQGLRKSTFWREMMPEPKWFDDNLSGDITNKDQLALLSRCVVQEWGEFDRITSSREAAELKSFVVRQNDVYRAPYERASTDHPRQSVIVGSVNKSEFLGDETGDRRYWVCEVEEKIDTDALIAEREELLAAAVSAYKAGELLYLSEEDEALSAENNLQYRVQDPWLPQVEEWLGNKRNLLVRGVDDMNDWITTAKILTDCIGIESKALKQFDRTRIEKILGYLGWAKHPKQIRFANATNGQRAWCIPVVIPDTAPAQVLTSEQLEPPTQLDTGKREQVLSATPKPVKDNAFHPTHRTADGIEFTLERTFGQGRFVAGYTANGDLLKQIAVASITPIEGVAA
jgi:predicted P-loop ATPase